MRKENDFSNGGRIGEQHDQSVYPDAFSGGRGHTVIQCLNIIIIHPVGFVIAGLAPLNLLGKPLKLVNRIIEL